MGALMGKAMEDSMEKNQAFMLASQKMQMERQMQMQDYMREQMMAMQLARGRDLFQWWATFYGVATLAMLKGFHKTRKPGIIAPLLPLTFILGYQWDLAHGNKMQRIRAEADEILKNEMGLLMMPRTLPTLEKLDERREAAK